MTRFAKRKKGRFKFKVALSIIGGCVVGLVNGFFGGGGGMLCVPLLNKVLKEETKVAHATTILLILPISIATAIMYSVNGYFEIQAGFITMAGVVTGGITGALLLKVLPVKVVGLVFALAMIAAGIKMLV